MNTVEVEKVDKIALLAYWIKERELIRLKKEAGLPRPWTEDQILDNYRFTNVHREDDAVTKWIAAHWRNPFVHHSNLMAAMVLARMINLPETLEHVGFPEVWETNTIRHRIKERRDKGFKWLNSAYLITTCGVKMDKIDYIVDVADTVHHHQQKWEPGEHSLKNYHTYLTQFKGLGSFLSAQVVADLKNTPGHPLKNAPDWWSWAAVGPGSLRGLQAVLGRPDVPQRQFLALAKQAYKDVSTHFGGYLGICMQDFQNCLCEFSKYWRAYDGTGSPKQRY